MVVVEGEVGDGVSVGVEEEVGDGRRWWWWEVVVVEVYESRC